MYDKFAMFCIIDSLVPVTAIWLKNDEKINDHNYELVPFLFLILFELVYYYEIYF